MSALACVAGGLRGCDLSAKARRTGGFYRAFASTLPLGSVEYSRVFLGSLDRGFETDHQIASFIFFFCLLFLSSTLLSILQMFWNEREADNKRERRDFEDDEVKSHIRLSSAQPFI